jgi:amino-acid N-acetyltransferase
LKIRGARGEEIDAIGALLAGAGLPLEGLDSPELRLLVAEDGGRLVGSIGLERSGEHALLRSLVVDEAERGRGIGSRLCDRAEELARREGVRRLWLLTESARAFFESRGYRISERKLAPEEIRGTSEFERLCPASASLLFRELGQIAR